MKRKLLFAIIALLCSIFGGQKVHAAAADYLTGWTEVTSLPTDNAELNQYYYVFVATEADLMLAQEYGTGKLGDAQEDKLTVVYRTPGNPLISKKYVWMLSYDATYLYGIRNLTVPTHYMQSRKGWPWRVQFAWETAQSEWTQWQFAYADSKWTIQNKMSAGNGGGDNYYLGYWVDSSTANAYKDNMVAAGNKGAGEYQGKFKIYRISREDFNAPTDVTSTYLTNPGFDYDNRTVDDTNQTTEEFATNWKAVRIEFGRYGIYDSSKASDGTYDKWGTSTASNGNYYLRIRNNYNEQSETQNIHQNTAMSLPKGMYNISFDYKVAKRTSTNLNLTVSAMASSTSKGFKEVAIPQVAANTSYFSSIGWTKGDFDFTLDNSTDIVIDIKCNTYGVTEGASVALLDNFAINYYNINGSTLANLITQANSINDVTGDLASEITAAQAVYDGINNTPAYQSTIDDAITALTTAISFALYEAEKANAELIASSITSGVSIPTTKEEADAAVKSILVNEYNYVTNNFNADAAAYYGITIDQWTGTATYGGNSDTPQTNSNEKWGPSATTYYEQGANGWGSNAWTLNYTKTVTLPANTYVLKVAARASQGVTATLSATIGGTTITEALPNVGASGLGITTDGVASFDNNDTFANSDNGYGWQWRYLAFTLENEGEVTLQINASANSIYQWCSFGDVAVVSNVNTTAMETAYNNFTMQTLGFEDDEYAPYNNVGILEAYAEAAAIVAGTSVPSTQAEVDAITSTLTSPTWVQNNGDVDAIYNGHFSEANGNNPKGWTRSNNAWGQQITGLTAEANGVDAGTTTAWYYNTNGAWQYGNDGVYTMPLAAGQTYKLSFKYRKNNSDWQTWMKASILNDSDEGLQVVEYPGADDGTTFQSATAYFTTGATGNYILSIEQNGNAHLTDVSLVKATDDEITLSSGVPANNSFYQTLTLDRTFSTENWNTVCLPFDVAADKFAAVKSLESITVNGDNVTLNFEDVAGTLTAATPYLVKAKSGATTLTVNNVALNPNTTAGSASVTEGTTTVNFVGTFSQMNAPVGSYIISGTNFYLVDDNATGDKAVTVKPYRGYFTVQSAGAVKALLLDVDGTDGIASVETTETENSAIYNLAGQRVQKAQKGLYIINGKKVVVK